MDKKTPLERMIEAKNQRECYEAMTNSEKLNMLTEVFLNKIQRYCENASFLHFTKTEEFISPFDYIEQAQKAIIKETEDEGHPIFARIYSIISRDLNQEALYNYVRSNLSKLKTSSKEKTAMH